jgi:hypothetical protein
MPFTVTLDPPQSRSARRRRKAWPAMCNPYSLTKGPQAIRDFPRPMHDL